VAIFREILYEGYITKTPQPVYRYKYIVLKYVKIYETDKIICARYMWVRSVGVQCAKIGVDAFV
jgi:hypothetical protein